jgi:hypothetical protein
MPTTTPRKSPRAERTWSMRPEKRHSNGGRKWYIDLDRNRYTSADRSQRDVTTRLGRGLRMPFRCILGRRDRCSGQPPFPTTVCHMCHGRATAETREPSAPGISYPRVQPAEHGGQVSHVRLQFSLQILVNESRRHLLGWSPSLVGRKPRKKLALRQFPFSSRIRDRISSENPPPFLDQMAWRWPHS